MTGEKAEALLFLSDSFITPRRKNDTNCKQFLDEIQFISFVFFQDLIIWLKKGEEQNVEVESFFLIEVSSF